MPDVITCISEGDDPSGRRRPGVNRSDDAPARPAQGCEPGATARATRPLVATGKPVCEPHDFTGEPGAGNRHAGFGERGEETCPWGPDCGPVRKRRISHRPTYRLRASPRLYVRRDKAPFLSGCESRPATVVPAGGAALLRRRPNQSLRQRGRRQLDPSRRGEGAAEGTGGRWYLYRQRRLGVFRWYSRAWWRVSVRINAPAARGGLRTVATAAMCHRAPVDSHPVAGRMPTGLQ